MKRKTILILVFLYLIFAMPLCADIFDISEHSLSMQIETGIFYGTAYEILYETSHSENYVSELQWNMKPLWFVGAFFEYAPQKPLAGNAIFFNFDLKIGIPSKTGVMEDRDWLDTSKPNVLTLFSSHDNKTVGAFIMNGAGGFSIPLAGNFLAKISLDYMMIFNYFEAWDGYTQYGTNTTNPPYYPWSPNLPKNYFSGLGVSYLQLWTAVNPVFGIEWHKNKFIFKSAFSFNTNIYSLTFDYHHARTPPFYIINLSAKGFLFDAKGSFFYNISNSFSVGVSLAYTSVYSRGNLAIQEKNAKDAEAMANGGGSGFKVFTGEFMLKIVY